MDFDWLNSLGNISPVVGIALCCLMLWSTRTKDRESAGSEKEKLRIALASNDTDRVAEIMDGYKEQVRGLRDELGDVRTQLLALANENHNLTDRNETLLVHIGNLERMIPNPPGPPTRPWLL